MVIKHPHVAVPNEVVQSAFWNQDHSGTAEPEVHDSTKHSVTYSIPGDNVSDFVNDAGYITSWGPEVDPVYSAWIAGPPNVSEFTNDAGYIVAEADPVFTAWDKDHADLSNVTADQHHAKQHAITATADHTSAATSGKMLKADANGLPVNATNTDAEIADAVTLKHAQAHKASHITGGSDIIDTATAAATGLLPILSNVATEFLNGQGAWAAPAGAGMQYSDTRFKVGTFDKNLADAPGNIVISGLGFAPKAVLLFNSIYNTTTVSFGFFTAAGQQQISQYTTVGNFTSDTNWAAILFTSPTAQGRMSLSSMDADGFTLAYTKGGTPAGNCNCRWLAFR